MMTEAQQKRRVAELTRSLYRDQVAERERRIPTYKKETASKSRSELEALEEEQRLADMMAMYKGEASATKNHLEAEVMRLEHAIAFEEELKAEYREKLTSRGLNVVDEFAPECVEVRIRRDRAIHSASSRGDPSRCSSAATSRATSAALSRLNGGDKAAVTYASGTTFPLPQHAKYSPTKNSILAVSHPIHGDILTKEEVADELEKEHEEMNAWRKSRMLDDEEQAEKGEEDSQKKTGHPDVDEDAMATVGQDLSLVVLSDELSVEERASIVLHGTY